MMVDKEKWCRLGGRSWKCWSVEVEDDNSRDSRGTSVLGNDAGENREDVERSRGNGQVLSIDRGQLRQLFFSQGVWTRLSRYRPSYSACQAASVHLSPFPYPSSLGAVGAFLRLLDP